MHSAIGFVTPDDRHTGRDIAILDNRKVVYAEARQRHPRRWTGQIRKWHRPRVVMLNPATTKVRLKAQAMVA
jgi:putative transposase